MRVLGLTFYSREMSVASSSHSTFLTLADCHSLKARLEEANDAETLCVVLRKLQGAATSVKNLSESRIARLVKKQLCKHPDARVSTLAHELVSAWTQLLAVDVVRRQSSSASSSSDTAGSGSWHDSEDVVAYVLKHCSVLTLLALKRVARSWNARVLEICHSPGSADNARLLGPGTADLTLQLSSGKKDKWVHCAALLRTLTATHTMCCYDARWLGSPDYHQLQVSPDDLCKSAWPNSSLQISSLQSSQRSWFHRGKTAASRFLELVGLVHVAMHSRTLCKLHLGYSTIGADGVGAVAQALLAAPTLHWLDIGSNPLGDEGVALLAAALCADGAAQLQSLVMPKVGLTARGVRPLADYLARPACSLHYLNLSGNSLGAAGAAALGSGLATNVKLEGLVITGNQIRDEGMHALGTVLLNGGHSRNLHTIDCDAFITTPGAIQGTTTLNLSHKSLGLSAVVLLAGVLCTNKYAHTLDLSRAYLDDDGGTRALALIVRMLQINTTLTALRLDGEPLPIAQLRGDDAVEELSLSGRRLGPLSALLIGKLLRTNRTLRSLDLSNNAIGDDGANALAKELGANRERALTSLNLAGNGRISSRTAKALDALVKRLV